MQNTTLQTHVRIPPRWCKDFVRRLLEANFGPQIELLLSVLQILAQNPCSDRESQCFLA